MAALQVSPSRTTSLQQHKNGVSGAAAGPRRYGPQATQRPRLDKEDSLSGDDIISAYETETLTDSPSRQAQPTSHHLKPVRQPPRRTESNQSGRKDAAKTAPTSATKKDGPFDLIDRLDISGLYGGGSMHRHDGPYAAATASRNKGPRAPMAAFDPSALAPPLPAVPTPSRAAGPPSGDRTAFAGDTPPHIHPTQADPVAMTTPKAVSMGFPTNSGSKGKGQQLAEIYGVRDNEAWEDFGTSRYATTGAHPASGGNTLRTGLSKDERTDRTQSIWDMEATIKTGKPVGRTTPPPPMPIFSPATTTSPAGDSPSYLSVDDSAGKPKRSKSLVARFKSGRRNPSTSSPGQAVPLGPDSSPDSPSDVKTSPFTARPSAERAHTSPFDKQLPDPSESPSAMAAAGRSRSHSHASPSADDWSNSRAHGSPGAAGETLGRKPSVMQRILGKKGRA